MRSVLVFLEDNTYLNRIKVMLHDKTITYHYVGTADEVIETIDTYEIAVTVLMLESKILSGKELIEVIYDKNPKMQIVLLFDDSQTAEALKIHNEFHMSKMLCRDTMSLDEIPKALEEALYFYNEEEYLKGIEIEQRKVEDKYKQTMRDMTHILNDRMEGYDSVSNVLVKCLGALRKASKIDMNATEEQKFEEYLSTVYSEYTQIFLLSETIDISYLGMLEMKYSNEADNRFLRVDNKVETEIEDIYFDNIYYLSSVISSYYNLFYSGYRAVISLTEEPTHYILNIIYEVSRDPEVKECARMLLEFNDSLIKSFSTRSIFGENGRVIQNKILIKKKANPDG